MLFSGWKVPSGSRSLTGSNHVISRELVIRRNVGESVHRYEPPSTCARSPAAAPLAVLRPRCACGSLTLLVVDERSADHRHSLFNRPGTPVSSPVNQTPGLRSDYDSRGGVTQGRVYQVWCCRVLITSDGGSSSAVHLQNHGVGVRDVGVGVAPGAVQRSSEPRMRYRRWTRLTSEWSDPL